MGNRLYGPGDKWPSHSKSWWEETLAQARTSGWSLWKFSSHAFGRIVCDPHAEDSCKILVLSTGAGGESVALDARRRIKRCRHAAADGAGRLLADAGTRLDGAGLLLEAADACLRACETPAKIEELLALADQAAADAEALLDQALALEEKAQAETVKIYGLDLPADVTLGVPPGAADAARLLSLAGDGITEAEDLIAQVSGGEPGVERLRERVGQAQARLKCLRERLARAAP